MIALIRINLLSVKDVRKKRGGEKLLLVLLAILAVEAGGMALWYSNLSSTVEQQRRQIAALKRDVEDLNKIKAKIEEREKHKRTITQQNIIFEELKYDKIGPPNALLFLSYVLTPKEDNVYNAEELKAQEEAGWDVTWDPSRVWLTEFTEEDGKITIQGQAIDHEDVTEFYRRLESSIYFYDVMPGVQEIEVDKDIDAKYVKFTVTANLNYDLEGVPRPKSTVAAGARSH